MQLTTMPRMLQCQTCSRSFSKTTDLHEHVELFKARARDLTIELLNCLAHITSLTGESPESPGDEGDALNIDTHDGIGGIDDDDDEDDDENHENNEEDSASFGSDHNNGKEAVNEDRNCFEIDENNGGAGERPRIPCPRTDCHTKFPSWTRLERHYQTHVSCHEVCYLCKRTFDRVSLFVDHKCKKLEGSYRTRILARRRVLRILVSQDLKKNIAGKERATANQKIVLSQPQERTKTQAHNAILLPYGNFVTASDRMNNPMLGAGITTQQIQDIPQTLTNSEELIDAGNFHLSPSGMSMDAMVMAREFISPPGPSRGSIFGSQNIGFPFVDESHSEARGALFYAGRLGGSWPHAETSHYQFSEGGLPMIPLESQRFLSS